jgi:hypothetical protein
MAVPPPQAESSAVDIKTSEIIKALMIMFSPDFFYLIIAAVKARLPDTETPPFIISLLPRCPDRNLSAIFASCCRCNL